MPDLPLLTVGQCTALCWKTLLSCILRQRAFPIFLPVLVLHHSNVSTLLPAAGTKLRFGFSVNLKLVTLMFEGSLLSDFAKAIWFMASSITAVKALYRAAVSKVHRFSITKTFIISDDFLQWFWFFLEVYLSFYHSSESEGLPGYQLIRCFLNMFDTKSFSVCAPVAIHLIHCMWCCRQ